ncbi:MAG: 3-hydroxyacyl-CoA dehydrogenase NAD-binding domain-containing protein [Thermoanaerobaculia bacterium]|nr:3-hydroxyacyl-CoA dehydrogenase NAD-binding domain-containing protein [Thermoanaerobaculia bacterium]
MSECFELNVGQNGLATLTFDLPGKSVNLLGTEAMDELEERIVQLRDRDDISVLVLLSGKKTNFIAGADVEEIRGVEDPNEAEQGSRRGQQVFEAWENLPFPTVAAVRGTCMGGGTELALASTFFVISDFEGTKIGLPEVKLGIVPAWGGCTRMPRRIGIQSALNLILAGKTVRPRKALKIGLADALLPDAQFLTQVRDFALARRDRRTRESERPDLTELLLEKNPVGRKILFDQARKRTLGKTGGHYPAPLRALEVVRIGIEEGRTAGFEAEARAVGELATSPICKNLIHLYQLREGAKKGGLLGDEHAHEVGQVAVVGAGVMGGGIAHVLAEKAGLPVRLKDIEADPLAGGVAHASKRFAEQVQRGRLDEPEAERRLSLIRPSLDYNGFSDCDLMIEAVVENLEVKREVFAEVAEKLPPEAILASNTSSLSIDAIVRDTPTPSHGVGMHFFNPVHRMPLVEVVLGARTEPVAANTIIQLARELGKTPVLVKDSPGFLVNRLLGFYMVEALWLLQEGVRIEEIDGAIDRWGMPMGPIALMDEVGVDIAIHVAEILHDAFGDRLPLPAGMERLLDDDRLGAKSRRGFYIYDGEDRDEPDEEIYELLGIDPLEEDANPSDLVDRMILPMVDEAARCLEEEVVRSPGDLDLAMVMGTGFPPFRGGLCRWADRQGVSQVVVDLDRLATSVGDRFEASEALRSAAEQGGFYEADWEEIERE